MVQQSATKSKKNYLNSKKRIRPHVLTPLEDIEWLRHQSPSVIQLWMDCARAEQYGKQQRKIECDLSHNSFRAAKTLLEQKGLFKFEPITKLSQAGRIQTTGWKVENLHGYYYQRKQQREKLNAGDYQNFLRSDYWQEVRKIVKERDGCCQYCNASDLLQVHHLTYEHHGDELNHLEDLLTLCRKCHSIEHNKEV